MMKLFKIIYIQMVAKTTIMLIMQVAKVKLMQAVDENMKSPNSGLIGVAL